MRAWAWVFVLAWVTVACGDDSAQDESSPEATVPDVRVESKAAKAEPAPGPLAIPPESPLPAGPPSALAHLAAEDSTAYFELAPFDRWEAPFGWIADVLPRGIVGYVPHSSLPKGAADDRHPFALALQKGGRGRVIFRVADAEALTPAALGERSLLRKGDLAAVAEDSGATMPAGPAPIASDLPAGFFRARLRIPETLDGLSAQSKSFRNLMDQTGLAQKAEVLDALRASGALTLSLGGDDRVGSIRADLVLAAPAFENASVLPDLLAALPEHAYPIVIAADAGLGTGSFDPLARLKAGGPLSVLWLAPLLSSVHLDGGFVLAARPEPDRTQVIQIVRGPGFAAYFRELIGHLQTLAQRTPYLQATTTETKPIAEATVTSVRLVPDWEAGLPTRGEPTRMYDLFFRYGTGAPNSELLAAIARRIEDRMLQAGLDPGGVYVRDGGIAVAQAHLIDEPATTRKLVERPFGFELRRVVSKDSPTFAFYRGQLAAAGDDAADGLLIPPDKRAPEDIKSQRYPLGLRWYPVRDRHMVALSISLSPKEWLLCELDPEDVGSSDVADAWHVPVKGSDGDYHVRIRFRDEAANRLERVCGKTPTELAYILGGRVECAAKLRKALPLRTRIPDRYIVEHAARVALAVRTRPLRHELRFEKKIPARRFMRRMEAEFDAMRSLFPDRSFELRGVDLGTHGIVGINVDDEIMERAIERVRGEGAQLDPNLRNMIEQGSGEPRVLADINIEPVLAILVENHQRLTERLGTHLPNPLPPATGDIPPSLRVLASGGRERLRFDIAIGTSLGRRIAAYQTVNRTADRARDLYWRYRTVLRDKPSARPTLAELDPQGDLRDPWGKPYELQRHEDGSVVVRSNGPDGVRKTDDDIIEPPSRWARARSPNRSPREWFDAYVGALKSGDPAQVAKFATPRFALSDPALDRWLERQLADAALHRRLRIVMRREPHRRMDRARIWEHLAHLDKQLLDAGKFEVEFLDAVTDDDETRIRARYRRDGREGVATASVTAKDGRWEMRDRFDWYGE